ncbi:DsrE family protein [Phenylobacterium sp.]|uniref:DsrE family protein n=1 Tax=Phenylobacterium sp. TaxID=1871053 RepID=UPI0035B1F037
MNLSRLACAAFAFALCSAGAATAQTAAIPGYGSVAPLPDAREQPDAGRDYKAVFDISGAPKAPDKVTPGLDRAARLVNILTAGGVPADKRHIALVVHGGATDAVTTDEVYAKRHDGLKNPNTALIAALQAAGVSVRICGQSMHGRGYTPADLAPGVQVDLAALMTVTHLQLDGYALIVN